MEDGYALILAWPETKCKQAGAWYDNIMEIIGVSKNGYYKVGHAAIVLIDVDNRVAHYFDFGRYHAPKGNGRIRSQDTDHDLTIHTPIEINEKGELLSLYSILSELQQNSSCHGTGRLEAGITRVNFYMAYQKAIELQKREYLPYGPFVYNGTNCSRFVRSVAMAGMTFNMSKLKLMLPPMLTPTPLWNVQAIGALLTEQYTQTKWDVKQNNIV